MKEYSKPEVKMIVLQTTAVMTDSTKWDDPQSESGDDIP